MVTMPPKKSRYWLPSASQTKLVLGARDHQRLLEEMKHAREQILLVRENDFLLGHADSAVFIIDLFFSLMIASVNPATGEVLRTFEPLTDAQIEQKLRCAADAFPKFRKLAFADRARMMNRAAEILEADKEPIGRLMTMEMGKTFRSAVDEAVKCAWACRYYAENAERFLADEVVETAARTAVT